MMLRALRRSGFWSFAAAFLLAAQLALAFHVAGHKFDIDAATRGDDCAICQVASTMAPGAKAAVAAPPTLVAGERIVPAAQSVPLHIRAVADFQSRAPPTILV